MLSLFVGGKGGIMPLDLIILGNIRKERRGL
jgi:hypothetical protein